jgi:transcriptional regulator with XRE-family HTH domain
MSETIGHLIRLHRQVAKLSQRELAEAIGAVETTIWRIENNRVTPTMDTVVAIAQALKVKVDGLLPRIEEEA